MFALEILGTIFEGEEKETKANTSNQNCKRIKRKSKSLPMKRKEGNVLSRRVRAPVSEEEEDAAPRLRSLQTLARQVS